MARCILKSLLSWKLAVSFSSVWRNHPTILEMTGIRSYGSCSLTAHCRLKLSTTHNFTSVQLCVLCALVWFYLITVELLPLLFIIITIIIYDI